MKMSFFWAVMLGLSIVNLCEDFFKSDYSFWFYLNIVSLGGSIYYYLAYRKQEIEADKAKRQLINIFISNVDEATTAEAAKRAAEQMKYDL